MKNNKTLLQTNLETWNYINYITSYTANNKSNYSPEIISKYEQSSTVWIGNLPVDFREGSIYALFGIYGLIKNIILGVNRLTGSTVGFAFVEYFKRENAINACILGNGMKINEQYLKVDLDIGFEPGREFGRGNQGFTKKQEREFNRNSQYKKVKYVTNYNQNKF